MIFTVKDVSFARRHARIDKVHHCSLAALVLPHLRDLRGRRRHRMTHLEDGPQTCTQAGSIVGRRHHMIHPASRALI